MLVHALSTFSIEHSTRPLPASSASILMNPLFMYVLCRQVDILHSVSAAPAIQRRCSLSMSQVSLLRNSAAVDEAKDDQANNADDQDRERDGDTGWNNKEDSVWQAIPESMQDGDEEIGQNHREGDAEAMGFALTEKYCPKNGR